MEATPQRLVNTLQAEQQVRGLTWISDGGMS